MRKWLGIGGWGLVMALCGWGLLVSAPARVAGQETPSTNQLPATNHQSLTTNHKSVTAEGRAAIGAGGVLAARRAATAQALRNAVERTTGVYVAARTTAVNYALLRDEVITKAEGFATLDEVLGEKITGSEVRVWVRATVSLRPLAARLKTLGLTRAWRVHARTADKDAAAALAALEGKLAEAGFVVVPTAKDADLLVTLAPRYAAVQNTPLETAAGPMTMHSVRGDVTLKAARKGTGEVVAAYTAPASALHINAATARAKIAGDAVETLAGQLTDGLLLLPARDSLPVTLVVGGLSGAAKAGKLEDALTALPGVRRIVRRSFAKGQATWELDVLSDAQPDLPRDLETHATLRPFRLRVSAEDRAKIVASAK